MKGILRFALCCALIAGILCSCTDRSQQTDIPPETEPPTTRCETLPSQWIPAEPEGFITITPPIRDGRDILNREDEFEADVIGVCNSKYTVPAALREKILAIMGEYKFETTFYVIDLKSGMSIGYNPEVSQATASTVKAGFCFCCMMDIAETEHSLDDKMIYRSYHKLSGSGSTQYSEFGTIFTIRALLYRTLYNSDNTAYYMLLDYFGTERYNAYMESIGVSHRLDWEGNDRWGYMSAHELGLIWQAIYNYRDKTDEGKLLWEYLTTNLYNEIGDTLTQYETVAHKSGWNEEGYHDSGVVCTPNGDYVIVVMTKTGDRNRCLHRVIAALDEVMQDYYAWAQKQR